MKARPLFAVAMICMMLTVSGFSASQGLETRSITTVSAEWVTINGLVENPVNLTYSSLWSLPLVSEIANLQCVGGGQGGPSVTYNWTGVPLFYLLDMARVAPGAYRKVVFNAIDNFSSSIPLATAMDPTTLLGLEVNGTDLKQVGGLGGGYRIVLPCRWGYKWVSNVKEIIVVDYDYKGTYERLGFSDEALRPNCAMPLTVPQVQNFTAGPGEQYSVFALSDSQIESFSFEGEKLIRFNLSAPEQAGTYFYAKFSEGLMPNPYQAYVDHEPVKHGRVEIEGNMYAVIPLANTAGVVEIAHTSISITAFKTIVGYGYSLSMNCTVRNELDRQEAFNITVRANSTAVASEILILESGASFTVTFTWNTAGSTYGKHDISATVNATEEGANREYDAYVDRGVFVTVPGDVTGDGKVRVDDILAVAQSFGSNCGDSAYKPSLDINDDQKIRVDDILVTALHFGQSL